MEENKQISLKELINGVFKDKDFKTESIISRRYIPIMEKREIIEGIFNILTSVYDENKEKVEGKYDLEVDSIMSDIFIKVAIVKEYTNIDASNRLETFDTLSEKQLFEWIIGAIGKDATDFEAMFKATMSEKVSNLKEQQLFNKQSPMDEFFTSLTSLVNKLDGIDLKAMTEILPQMAQLGKTGLNQDNLVKLILANKPQDHKSPKTTKKATTTSDKSKPKTKKATSLEVVIDVDKVEK